MNDTNFVPFHPAKKQPSPYLVHKYPKSRIVRISSCSTLFYCPISMATPKANNDHFLHKKHEFLQAGIYSSEEPVKSMDLTRIMRISCLSRLQGPFPAPSWTKNIQQAEFQVTPTIAPSCPFRHNKIILNFEVFGTRKADIQCKMEE